MVRGCLPARSVTVDGFEQHLSINHLGSFLFTNLTLLKICGAKEGRITAVASSATITSHFRLSDPDAEKTAKDVPEPKKSTSVPEVRLAGELECSSN
jgi:NAD(P)-dependent dehydrogenase (short-subunit alcohol dehydrogenase family)